MSDLELEQVRLELTKDPAVLSVLRTKKLMRKEKDGAEFMEFPFNSIGIRFHKGEVKTLSKSVANSICKTAFVNTGDDLTGDFLPILDVVEVYSLGDTISERNTKSGLFTCPVPDCGKPMASASSLGYHLSKFHSDKQEKAGALIGAGPDDEQGGEGENDL